MENNIQTQLPVGSNPMAGEPSIVSILRELSKFEVDAPVTIYLFGNGNVQLCEEGYMPANYHF